MKLHHVCHVVRCMNRSRLFVKFIKIHSEAHHADLRKCWLTDN